MTKEKRATNIVLIYAVRYMLLVPIVVAIGSIIYAIATKEQHNTASIVIGGNLRIIALSLVAIGVTIAFSRLEKHYHVHLPRGLMAMIMLLLVASLVAGDAYGLYERLWWWDDVLHTMAGVVTAMTGFLLVYFLNARYNMRINPLFIALFAFTFAITMGVVWEIIEFSFDVLLKTDMQRWYVPHGTPLIGRDYQGNGLRDTMSDLIVSCVGALAVSVIAYFSYKNERRSVLRVMRRTFPGASRRS